MFSVDGAEALGQRAQKFIRDSSRSPRRCGGVARKLLLGSCTCGAGWLIVVSTNNRRTDDRLRAHSSVTRAYQRAKLDLRLNTILAGKKRRDLCSTRCPGISAACSSESLRAFAGIGGIKPAKLSWNRRSRWRGGLDSANTISRAERLYALTWPVKRRDLAPGGITR